MTVMSAAIDFVEAKRRLRPPVSASVPARVSNEPLIEAVIQTRRMWVGCLGLAFAMWGLELRDRRGGNDGN